MGIGFAPASSPMASTDASLYSVTAALEHVYGKKIFPCEDRSLYNKFFSPALTTGEISAKPMVLLLGQYSTGKTTFIQHLLGRSYPGCHIGPEPTTDRFVAVTYGEEERVIPGNAATIEPTQPFSGLSQFGSSFLSKFQVSTSPAALLESVTFIDTPGVLSGDKQKLGRSYDFVKICQWFAERADMILLLFDAHKLDISDELKDVISAIRPYEDKVKIVLNKADQVSTQELMRVYGALMWSLGKTIHTPEVVRVYIGSFRSHSQKADSQPLLDAEQRDLLDHLLSLPRESSVRKINEMIKRAKQVRVHTIILNELRNSIPAFFGKASKQNKLLVNMKDELERIRLKHSIHPSDIPDPAVYQQCLKDTDFSSLPKQSTRLLTALEEAINYDIPRLLASFSKVSTKVGHLPTNPYDNTVMKPQIDFDSAKERYLKLFHSCLPDSGKLSGEKVRSLFASSGLSESQLASIWDQADADRDGYLNEAEFCTAMRVIDEIALQQEE